MANQAVFKETKFCVGDIIRVSQAVKEEKKDKVQIFEGRVISIRGRNPNITITLRRLGIDNVGVERIYPLSSPTITKIEVKKSLPVKRAKLYTLRRQK